MAISSFAASPLLLGAAVVLIISLCLYIRFRRSKNALHPTPTEWPILGVLPLVISVLNSRSFHDSVTSVLAVAKLLNFRVRAPGLCYFLTCDPENVRHIFTTSFDNYPKGDGFASVFPLLEGTILTADGEPWRRQRRKIHHVLTSPPFLAAVSRACRDKVARGLVPALARMAAAGTAFDAEDILGRLVFDMAVMLVFGEDDPCSLPPATNTSNSKPPPTPPPMHVAEAMDALMEVAFFRHTVPTLCWKTMRRFGVGPERNVAAAEAVLSDFVAEKIQTRIAGRQTAEDEDGGAVDGDDDILYHYINDPDFLDDGGAPTDFMHRTFMNFLVALRDPVASALPWFVYSLATHPRVVSAVRDELAPIAAAREAGGGGGMVVFEPDELERLVYLRAALLESLRLYPSTAPVERKVAADDDVLPSGHAVRAGDNVLVLVYSMARMESIWGEDCREYRPERWLISEDEDEDGRRTAAAGKYKLRVVPSYKFLSFNTGPRSCLGKTITRAQMMTIAAAVVWNFDVEVVEGHAVETKHSVLLQMKNGLMVRVHHRGQPTSSSSVVVRSS